MEIFKAEMLIVLLLFVSTSFRHADRLAVIGQSDDTVLLLANSSLCCRQLERSAVDVHSGLVSVPPALLLCRSSRHIFLPRERRSLPAVVTALLLLRGGVEPNPGPANFVSVGVLNVRSVVHKAALLHSLIADECLDILALTETWASLSDPPAILQDPAPVGYNIMHVPRPSSEQGK